MEDEKVPEILAKLYGNMTDEQKKRALECKTVGDFMAIVEREGVEIPDGLIENVAGGVSLNESVLNYSLFNIPSVLLAQTKYGKKNSDDAKSIKGTGKPDVSELEKAVDKDKTSSGTLAGGYKDYFKKLK